jgi:hypothetical protein
MWSIPLKSSIVIEASVTTFTVQTTLATIVNYDCDSFIAQGVMLQNS